MHLTLFQNSTPPLTHCITKNYPALEPNIIGAYPIIPLRIPGSCQFRFGPPSRPARYLPPHRLLHRLLHRPTELLTPGLNSRNRVTHILRKISVFFVVCSLLGRLYHEGASAERLICIHNIEKVRNKEKVLKSGG